MSTPVREIEVLGPGCARCNETRRAVQRVVDDAELDRLVQNNTSIDRMVALGVLSAPAVASDGRVVLSGHVPKTEEPRKLLGQS